MLLIVAPSSNQFFEYWLFGAVPSPYGWLAIILYSLIVAYLLNLYIKRKKSPKEIKTTKYVVAIIIVVTLIYNVTHIVIRKRAINQFSEALKDGTWEAERTKPTTLEIPDYNSSSEERYNIVLTIPHSWADVEWIAGSVEYGEIESQPNTFIVNGEYYGIIAFGDIIFYITSIPKEHRYNEVIPDAEEFITEYRDRTYFIRYETENVIFLGDIPEILDNMEFQDAEPLKG